MPACVVDSGVFDDEESDSEIEAEFERTRKPGGYFGESTVAAYIREAM